MWEKIVLNLLSNAFKFTFEGEIAVSVTAHENLAVLTVRDTGTGIPASELPRLFERFHRIEGARGRSFEGSGIGLALVQELVKLHGGTIGVDSTEGEGTAFTVSIPFGTAHLRAHSVEAKSDAASSALRAQAYVEEALRWLPGGSSSEEILAANLSEPPPVAAVTGERARIVLAEDNADMRDYVSRLLGGRHEIEAVADGEAALAALRRRRPDLVLTDIMMPRLDGFGLIRAIRDDPELRDLPVIVLSARAGEEASIEGLEAGADDYLVKPFAARELIARIDSNLALARLRREAAERERELRNRFETVVKHLPIGAGLFGPDGKIVLDNAEFRRFVPNALIPSRDANAGEWIGYHPDGRRIEKSDYVGARALRGEVVQGVEFLYRAPDGEECWTRLSGIPIRNADGQTTAALVTILDIDDTKRAEIKIRESADALHRQLEERETLLRALPVGVFVAHDPQCTSISMNPAGAAMLRIAEDANASKTGPEGEQLPFRVFKDGVEVRNEDLPMQRAARVGEPVVGEEFQIQFADGDTTTLYEFAEPLFDGEGKVRGSIGVFVDITERKRAAEALAALAGEREATLGQLTEGVIVTDARGQITFVNKAAEELHGVKMLGVPPDQYSDAYHLLTEDGRPYPPRELPLARAVLNGETVLDARWLIRRPDGSEIMAIGSARPILGPEGEQIGAVLTLRDDTKRLAAESALRESEAFKSAILETALDCIVSIDERSRIIEFNPAAERVFGYTRAAAIGKSMPDLIMPPEFRERHHQGLARYLATGDAQVLGKRIEVTAMRSDGTHFPVELAITRTAGGGPALFTAYLRDITERKRAEDRLRESEARFRNMADNAPVMVWTTDPTGYCTYLSRSWYEFTGQTPETGLGFGWLDATHPDDKAEAERIFIAANAKREAFRLEYRLLRTDGEYRWAIDAASPRFGPDGEFLGYVGSVIDITERKDVEDAQRRLNELLKQRVAEEIAERAKTEEQLRQAQKMEAIGHLTGGVAHDFNNLLTIVIGNLESLQRHLPANSPDRLRRSTENAMLGAKRAATLTQRLLAFSRRQPLEPKPVDINKVVSGMSDMLGRTLGESIEVQTVLAGGLWRIEVDPNQLESTLLNLVVNARDAMPSGGRLTIETANAHLDEAYAAKETEVIPGQYVVLCVSDTGTGMSKEVLSRAFEPFFTTKATGHGTGLGLSQVYGFVKQSGGHVKIYSEPGEGTTVKIYLPRFVGAEDEQDPVPATVPDGQHAETILVVEDDDGVREYTSEILRELGYRILEAHDGPSALRQLDRHKVDLLFTDVGLPGMNGRQLVDAARKQHPKLKVLFTTGYARNAIVHHGRLDPGVQMIGKPFTYADLAAKVRSVIDGNR
jgi:PAS domain S-box-containing protein